MDKKIKAFFAAMGIATALLVPVSASADNSDSKVQVSIDITWDSLEFTYTDGQWDPETHSYKGGGWSDSGGNFMNKKVDEFIEEIQKSRRGHDLSEDDVDEHKSDML